MYSVLFPFTKPYSLSVQGSAINPMIYVYVPMFLTSTVKLMSLLTLSYLFPSFSLSSDWVFLAKLCHIISLSPLLKLTSSDLFFLFIFCWRGAWSVSLTVKKKKNPTYLPTFPLTVPLFLLTYLNTITFSHLSLLSLLTGDLLLVNLIKLTPCSYLHTDTPIVSPSLLLSQNTASFLSFHRFLVTFYLPNLKN